MKSRIQKAVSTLAALAFAIASLAAAPAAWAQQSAAPPPAPEGYIARGTRPGKGLAPGMKVSDLGKGGRAYRIEFVKGDEIMSGLTDFAEKHHIRNAHFTGLGAINKGIFGWSPGRDGPGQKRIDISEEAEIVSLIGGISTDSQGRANVHAHGAVSFADGSVKAGHWWEARVGIIAVVYLTEEEAAN